MHYRNIFIIKNGWMVKKLVPFENHIQHCFCGFIWTSMGILQLPNKSIIAPFQLYAIRSWLGKIELAFRAQSWVKIAVFGLKENNLSFSQIAGNHFDTTINIQNSHLDQRCPFIRRWNISWKLQKLPAQEVLTWRPSLQANRAAWIQRMSSSHHN